MFNLQINLSKSESTRMWIDITKFLTIAIIVHLLLYAVDEYGELFDETILKLLLYLTFGIVIYHLIIRKQVDKHILCKTPPEQQNVTKKTSPKANKKKSILRKNRQKKKNNKKVTFKE